MSNKEGLDGEFFFFFFYQSPYVFKILDIVDYLNLYVSIKDIFGKLCF